MVASDRCAGARNLHDPDNGAEQTLRAPIMIECR
jgi:hypothetical protein